ncbi:MAG: hypothetical protein IKS30_00220, partial [Treponema sp.]|nr:hypothetical protein [Treponema sp.]
KRLLQHFEGSQASRSERSRIPITFNHAKTDALSWKCTYYRHFFKELRHLNYLNKSRLNKCRGVRKQNDTIWTREGKQAAAAAF